MKRVLFIGLTLSACVYNKQEKLPVPKTQNPVNDTTVLTTITYTNFVKKVMDDNCVVCHAATGLGVNPFFTTYNEVKAQGLNGRIKARVIDEIPTRMPIGASLPKSTKDSIQIWINNGFPE